VFLVLIYVVLFSVYADKWNNPCGFVADSRVMIAQKNIDWYIDRSNAMKVNANNGSGVSSML
jgi:hypothetical protein